MQQIYYSIACIVYGIFIIQFILSWFGGDSELDVDLDGDTDLSINDIVSFKGLIHFLMGFSGYLCLVTKFTWITYIIAAGIGLLFMVILYYSYKFCLKLQHQPIPEDGDQLVGRKAIIYLPMTDYYWLTIEINGTTSQIKGISTNTHYIGEIVTIKEYKNGIYYF